MKSFREIKMGKMCETCGAFTRSAKGKGKGMSGYGGIMTIVLRMRINRLGLRVRDRGPLTQ